MSQMAPPKFSLSIFILFLSLAAIASANGYGDSPKPEAQKPQFFPFIPKPMIEKPKIDYVPKPQIEVPQTTSYGLKSDTKPTELSPDYGHKSETQTPQSIPSLPKQEIEKPKEVYEPKPKFKIPQTGPYAPKVNEIKKPYMAYAPQPDVEKPEGNGYGFGPKFKIPQTGPYAPKGNEIKNPYMGYAPQLDVEKPKGNGYGNGPKPKVERPTPSTGIQGLIYCKSGPKLVPLEGAIARITCKAIKRNGYEAAPFSFLSYPADAKGYFFTKVYPHEVEDEWKLTECKAFLHKSPLEACKVPTDVNKGLTGAPLSSCQLLKDKNVNLYSVGPFFYTPEPKPVSKGY